MSRVNTFQCRDCKKVVIYWEKEFRRHLSQEFGKDALVKGKRAEINAWIEEQRAELTQCPTCQQAESDYENDSLAEAENGWVKYIEDRNEMKFDENQ